MAWSGWTTGCGSCQPATSNPARAACVAHRAVLGRSSASERSRWSRGGPISGLRASNAIPPRSSSESSRRAQRGLTRWSSAGIRQPTPRCSEIRRHWRGRMLCCRKRGGLSRRWHAAASDHADMLPAGLPVRRPEFDAFADFLSKRANRAWSVPYVGPDLATERCPAREQGAGFGAACPGSLPHDNVAQPAGAGDRSRWQPS